MNKFMKGQKDLNIFDYLGIILPEGRSDFGNTASN